MNVKLGELVVENTSVRYDNSNITFTGNLTVGNGGYLDLTDCNLSMNSTDEVFLTIHIMKGGVANLTNTTLDQLGIIGYRFMVNGTLNMENCSISGMYIFGDPDNSGIRIGSGEVTINGSSIMNDGPYSKTLYMDNASPIIRNTIIYSWAACIELKNGSDADLTNVTFVASSTEGRGLLCVNSSFTALDCSFIQGVFGMDVESRENATIRNCSFSGNWVGMILSPSSGMSPLITGSEFSNNSICALYLYDNGTIENCTFENNVIPGFIEPIASIMLNAGGNSSGFQITNCTFTGNHNGLLVNNVSADITDCLFINNTRFGGSSGIIVYGPLSTRSVSIRGCTIREHVIGTEVIYAEEAEMLLITGNTYLHNGLALGLETSMAVVRGNEFTDNGEGIGERHTNVSTIESNEYHNNTVDRYFVVRLRIEVQDGYGKLLGGTTLTLTPSESVSDISPIQLTANSTGGAVADLRWIEWMSGDPHTLYENHPYTVTAVYKGVEKAVTVDEFGENGTVIIVPFLRPEFRVMDLEIAHKGFSIWSDDPRVDETSYVKFTIKNIGKGRAEDALVTVKTGSSTLKITRITLGPGEEHDFRIQWIPGHKGKINISVEVSHSDELNASENDLTASIQVGENQGGYYYLVVLLTILVISTLVWWMVGSIEGADDDMAEIGRNLRMKLAKVLEGWSRWLSVEPAEFPDDISEFIPSGDIYAWDGQPTLSGTGKYHPWTIEDENLIREKKRDIITVKIHMPNPETEMVIEEEAELETFEWVTVKGDTESIKVDKRTLTKISHPKMYICSLCDRNFVSVDESARCPWCGGKAIFIQDM